MKVHRLKTWRGPFYAVASGRKRFEWRRDDRGFAEGDLLELLCWDELLCEEVQQERPVLAEVTYVLRGPDHGVPEGYCVLSIELRSEQEMEGVWDRGKD